MFIARISVYMLMFVMCACEGSHLTNYEIDEQYLVSDSLARQRILSLLNDASKAAEMEEYSQPLDVRFVSKLRRDQADVVVSYRSRQFENKSYLLLSVVQPFNNNNIIISIVSTRFYRQTNESIQLEKAIVDRIRSEFGRNVLKKVQ